jgi:predicted acetyltransferase
MLKRITDANMSKYLELAQLYEEEFAPLTGASRDEAGIYPVSTQIDETHIGYFYCDNGNEIGFTVIGTEKEPYDVCEFFVHKNYRKQGAGQKLAYEIFNMYSVDWSVKQLYNAKHAHLFWLKVLRGYTNNNFTQHLYEDEKWGKVHLQLFTSKK